MPGNYSLADVLTDQRAWNLRMNALFVPIQTIKPALNVLHSLGQPRSSRGNKTQGDSLVTLKCIPI